MSFKHLSDETLSDAAQVHLSQDFFNQFAFDHFNYSK